MRGEVEIYANMGTPTEKLVFKGENNILPTMGRSIARMMVIPSSLGGGVSNSLSGQASATTTTTVGLYNVSAYGAQAMSFGKDASGYEGSSEFGSSAYADIKQPYIYNTHHCVNFSGDPSSTLLASAIIGVSASYLYAPKSLRTNTIAKINLNKLEPSSITAVIRQSMEDPTTGPSAMLVSAVSGDTGWSKTAATTMSQSLIVSGMQEAISELVRRDPGHNLNIASKPWYLLSHVSGIDQRKGDAVYAQASGFYNSLSPNSKTALLRFANLLGCYAPSGSPILGTSAVVVSSLNSIGTTWDNTIAKLSAGAVPTKSGSGVITEGHTGFNTQMDPFGFAKLTVNNATTASTTNYIEYQCVIKGGDKSFSNFYGGLHNAGLWGIDIDRTVQENENSSIPLNFDQLYNPLRYTLLAQRKVNDVIGYETGKDMENMNDFTVIWRLSFV
tara:strand:- start:1489 stop:2820 length:1332 start_codon:yes stop_codon:yes gene_type:complete